MELRHLRYFVAVAEEGHVTRAAERLGIQQPPLSQQIRALETELEVQLFRRKPRGVELTQAGEALLAEARTVLDRVEHAVAAARRTGRGDAGRIGLGCPWPRWRAKPSSFIAGRLDPGCTMRSSRRVSAPATARASARKHRACWRH